MSEWWQRLPPADHPIWKIAQLTLAVVLAFVSAPHGLEVARGQHGWMPDANDIAGIVGTLLVGNVARQHYGRKQS